MHTSMIFTCYIHTLHTYIDIYCFKMSCHGSRMLAQQRTSLEKKSSNDLTLIMKSFILSNSLLYQARIRAQSGK